jgi:phage shock protein PspC (stress-responsive transcriptional regulator)
MNHMNDTPQTDDAETAPPEGADNSRDFNSAFNRDGLRTLADMRRSSDDRIVAGVCAGVARHLNVDPIIIRIAVVALTFIGLSGLILYLAAWFLIPADDDPQSIAADWFNLDRNEEQVRTVGLFVALVLAVAAVVGDNGWGLWWLGWWVIPAAFLFWLFVVRPRRRRQEWLAGSTPVTPPYPPPAPGTADAPTTERAVAEFTAWKTQQVLDRKRRRYERRRESRILRGLTLSVALIAEAIVVIVDRTVANLPWTAYVAVALAVVAIGCLVGTMWGSAGGLIGIGLILTLVLAIGSVTPGGPIGQQSPAPHTLSDVHPAYRHGIGDFELDLSGVARPAGLAGRTVRISAGVGQTTVTVPSGIPVKVDASVQAGEITTFGRRWHGDACAGSRCRGTGVSVTDGKGKALHLIINQKFGEIDVIRVSGIGSTTSQQNLSAPEEIHP